MSTSEPPLAIFWFRRDLRLDDNVGLAHALKGPQRVLPVFIFDKEILDLLEDKDDARVTFIFQTVGRLRSQIESEGGSMLVYYGSPLSIFKKIIEDYSITAVYTNHDYESYAVTRDREIAHFFASHRIAFHTYKDQCIFEKSEVVKENHTPYTIFTPYKRTWLEKLRENPVKMIDVKELTPQLAQVTAPEMPTLHHMGFEESFRDFPSTSYNNILSDYAFERNFPGSPGTSRISVHLRFGTVSIRALVVEAQQHSEAWLNELIWRDFYFMILANFPYVEKSAFKPAYDRIEWINDKNDFEKWCAGTTGFPMVDAGMRELNRTGFMHNRVRMVVASFLTKDLLIDWRWGEAYFARKLLDYELSSNNGGWQWAAGSGCDAAPYFRIFNPLEQEKKFDPHHTYIHRWIPELNSGNYPSPMVDHKAARERCLAVYGKALKTTPKA